MAIPTLMIQFLNLKDGTFKAALPEQLQLRQVEPGIASLGVSESRQKTDDKGVPQTDADGNPLLESIFTPFINYPVIITKPEEAPKVELATEVPVELKKTSKVRRAKVQ